MENNDHALAKHAAVAAIYEACFIESVQELAERGNFKKGEFAQLVWPESSPKVARNRWEGMRTADCRTGKPITCSLSDAYRMAKVLNLQMSFVALQAEFLAEQRIKEMDRAGGEPSRPEAPQRGRRKKNADSGPPAEQA